MENNIRVFNKSIKKISVNDNGDYIEINVGDGLFPTKIKRITEKIDAAYMELIEKEREKMAEDELIDVRLKVSVKVGKLFDELFGENACEKTFGTSAPMQFMIIDFLEQLAPIINGFTMERQKMINSKYGKGKKK